MKRSFNSQRFFGALAIGTLVGAAVGALLAIGKGERAISELPDDVKGMTKNLEKKAKRQAKNLQREEWIAKEKDKIMSHTKQ
ncbi:MAG TPA: YtxH domain-containing protein [Prolixibacteraceae bacterium]|nr:YtxH domain-containing protein [Prolixibacteraceae bacterium]